MKHCVFLLFLMLNVFLSIQVFPQTDVDISRAVASDFVKRYNLDEEIYGKPYLIHVRLNGTGTVMVVKDSSQFNVFYRSKAHKDSIIRMSLPLTASQMDAYFSYADTLSRYPDYIERDTYNPLNYYIEIRNSSNKKVVEWDSFNFPNDKNLPNNVYVFLWILAEDIRKDLHLPDGVDIIVLH